MENYGYNYGKLWLKHDNTTAFSYHTCQGKYKNFVTTAVGRSTVANYILCYLFCLEQFK